MLNIGLGLGQIIYLEISNNINRDVEFFLVIWKENHTF